jgi:hypothetical protein
MAKIRILAENDLADVVELFGRVYPERRWASPKACYSYFREVLFDNPWRDLEIPSWVAEEGGRIRGVYAVMPRRMLLRGRPLRVAAACQFMVDPHSRSPLIAMQLAKACLSGPQDLTLADGASEQVRRMWIGVGGTASLLYSLHWTRLLRPARYAISLLEERAALPRAAAFAARPLCAFADLLFARLRPNRFYRETAGVEEDALDSATIAAHFRDLLRGYALQPAYDQVTLDWLLDQTARKSRHGELRCRAVRDGARKLIGWYLYYLAAGRIGEVVQIAALDGSFALVLRRLLADAWRHGVTALRGRLDPRFAQELSDRHCWLRTDSTWTLIHSRRADVLAAFERGDAFLSRLEGEWWLRFSSEGEATPEPPGDRIGAAGPGPFPSSRVRAQG